MEKNVKIQNGLKPAKKQSDRHGCDRVDYAP